MIWQNHNRGVVTYLLNEDCFRIKGRGPYPIGNWRISFTVDKYRGGVPFGLSIPAHAGDTGVCSAQWHVFHWPSSSTRLWNWKKTRLWRTRLWSGAWIFRRACDRSIAGTWTRLWISLLSIPAISVSAILLLLREESFVLGQGSFLIELIFRII